MGETATLVRNAAVVLLTAAAAALAWHFRSSSLSLAVLVLLAGSTPALALMIRAAPRWLTTALFTAGGLSLSVLGAVQAGRVDGLSLVTMGFPWKQVVTGAASQLSPYALVGAGLILVLAALMAWTGHRVLSFLVVVLTVCLAAVLAVALAGYAVAALRYRGGTVDRTAAVAALLVTGSGLLLLLLASAGQLAAPAAVVHSQRQGRGTQITARVSIVAVALLLAGGGVWGRQLLGGQELATLFPDPALAACVGADIDGGPATASAGRGRVSQRELNSIFSLRCSGERSSTGRISSLAGLENLPNLAGLSVPNNAVSDLTPLRSVPALTDLKLTGNQVTQLEGLEALTALGDLGLSSNQISDLTPLAGLTSLRALGLSQNAVTDVTPLARLQALEQLDITENQITSIAPLNGMPRLSRLTVARNRITGDGLPASLPALTMLNIEGNEVQDLDWAGGYPAVDELWIGGNPVTNLAPLLDMASLQGVDLAGSDATRITGTEELRRKGVYVGGLASGRETRVT